MIKQLAAQSRRKTAHSNAYGACSCNAQKCHTALMSGSKIRKFLMASQKRQINTLRSKMWKSFWLRECSTYDISWKLTEYVIERMSEMKRHFWATKKLLFRITYSNIHCKQLKLPSGTCLRGQKQKLFSCALKMVYSLAASVTLNNPKKGFIPKSKILHSLWNF